MWKDVDAVGAASSGPDTSANARNTASGDDNFSVAELAREAVAMSAEANNHNNNSAAADMYLPDAVPPLTGCGGGGAGNVAGSSSSLLPVMRDARDVYISDELMYHLYDGDGTGHGKIRLRRRHRHQAASADLVDALSRAPARTNGGDGGGGNDDDDDNNDADEDDDEDGDHHSHGRKGGDPPPRNPVLRYLSCLWPPESEEEKARLDQSAWGQKNWFMRLLLKERWTDGSLVGLKTDIFSGVTLAVAQVAPSIAFALMAGGPPLVGLFSSFWLGIIPCVFGGRPGQITAIAGAVVVLYPDLVKEHGVDAAYAVCLIAGCFILLPGIFRVAGLVRLLPASLMVGFCNGLGISMVIHQIPSFKDEHGDYVTGLRAFYTAIICIVSFAVMMLMPYFTSIIPSAFVAIVVGTLIQYIFQLKTVTIGDLYELHGKFPEPRLPHIDWTDSSVVSPVMVAAVLTAIISCVESFMSDYKIQQLTETPTNFEREAITLGIAHIINGFFQGMAGCVVFGPCILNIECGSGTRRLSGFICAVFMVIIPIALFAVIRIIPMAALSAVLFGVSSKTADWRMLAMIFLQRISFQESAVALIVTIVTVVQNLAIGAASGLAAALVFFMWNMSRGKIYITPVLSTASAGPQRMGPVATTTTTTTTTTAEAVQPVEDERSGGVQEEMEEMDEEKRNRVSGRAGAASPSPPTPTPPPLLPQQQRFMEVNVLNVEVDPVFPDIKVLRIHLRGVLFFGSCMEFVDSMIRLLRDCHEHIFLKVSDIILDFQHGRMPVMDFSAAEAIFDSANTFARRGIRTHVQNMDPLSYALFERCRRYFPLVLDDNVNNCKHQCFFRRVFQIQSTHETSHSARQRNGELCASTRGSCAGSAAAGGGQRCLTAMDDGALMSDTSFVTRSDFHAGSGNTGGRRGLVDESNHLQDDVFLRANRSFTQSFAEVAVTRRGPPYHHAAQPHRRAHHHDDDDTAHHFDPITKPAHSEEWVKDGDVELGTVANTATDALTGHGADSESAHSSAHDERQQKQQTQQQQQTAQRHVTTTQTAVVVAPAEVSVCLATSSPPLPTPATAQEENGSCPPLQKDNKTRSPASDSFSSAEPGDDADAYVVLRLMATEEQLPLEASIKVGFPVFRPHFGITVPVFATVSTWMTQLAEEELASANRAQRQRQQEEAEEEDERVTAPTAGRARRATPHNGARGLRDLFDDVVHELDRGVVGSRKPLDRQYGDFFFTKIWWRRLFNLDVPPPASLADEAQLADLQRQNATRSTTEQANPTTTTTTAAAATPAVVRVKEPETETEGSPASVPSAAFRLRARTAPTQFVQVPRFPGQGYAAKEILTRGEVARMKQIVCQRLFQQDGPRELACFPARMKKFEVDLMDGFI